MSKSIESLPTISPYATHDGLFRCPVCHSSVTLVDGRSMVCGKAHCFDISKHGYINWLTRRIHSKYDKQMFESRRAIHDTGLLDPLDEMIADQMKARGVTRVLDAGCGEGSHLRRIGTLLRQNAAPNLIGVGIDIAKNAISLASRKDKGLLWCVGDIGNLPFADGQFDCILNVLSPSNYTEFRRVLSKDGILVKVMPGPAYLQELRTLLYKGRDNEVYANTRTLDLLRGRVDLLDVTRVQYTFPVTGTTLAPLVHMTPLKWAAEDVRIQEALGMALLDVTIDLNIAVGKFRLQEDVCGQRL